ncbi:hypothetical protein Hypma_013868 [Hypsizygus marmoreus]|uniref:Protein kinase domain-containing protein n=1 Tax=Hypsizygus marmoreus TaxID=39966 RepID=A0A369KE73_HYPMA|nr:hypothetical protein Hypma_013868 [Hypsizygus marmoreus]
MGFESDLSPLTSSDEGSLASKSDHTLPNFGQTSRSSHHMRPVTPPLVPASAVPQRVAAMDGTPITSKIATGAPFTSNYFFSNPKLQRMATEMKSKFIGPMQPKAFLDEFLPIAEDAKKPWKWDQTLQTKFEDVASKDKEVQMYDPLIKALQVACGDKLVLVNTSAVPDMAAGALVPEGLKPDISGYKPDYKEQQAGPIKKITDFSLMEVHMELKKAETDDGFEDEGPVFERDPDNAIDTRGQITGYATAQLALQFRTHAFSVLLCGSNARFLRWDRTGAIVSACFDYTKEDLLLEFFWRYGMTNEEGRGKDMSISVPTPEEAEEARTGLGITGKDCQIPLLKFTVVDDVSNKVHYFVGHEHLLRANSSATGRATRVIKVWDLQLREPAMLKDTWRVALPGIDKEGDIYKELHKHGVPHISEITCAGDVRRTTRDSVDNHRTRTHLYADSKYIDRRKSWAVIEGLRPHSHYRIVLKTIGRSLTAFASSEQLVTAARDALEALVAAYEKAKIMHRDISIGNILIVGESGLLIDWDLAKRVFEAETDGGTDRSNPTNDKGNGMNNGSSTAPKPNPNGPRQMERSGTWQFIAARLLVARNVPAHTLADDMESLVHVLNWVSLRCMPHDLSPDELASLLNSVFNYHEKVEGKDQGGVGKEHFLTTGSIDTVGLKNPAMVSLLLKLAHTFAVEYERPPAPESLAILDKVDKDKSLKDTWTDEEEDLYALARSYCRRQARRKDPSWVLGLFKHALKNEKWTPGDGSVENKLAAKPDNGLKRKPQDKLDEYRRKRLRQKTKSSKGKGRNRKP